MKRNKHLLILVALLFTTLPIFGDMPPMGKSICVALDPKGKVVEFRFDNYSYQEIAGIIAHFSGLEIEVNNMSTASVTYAAKNCSWDTIIWGLFNKNVAKTTRVDTRHYRITGIPKD